MSAESIDWEEIEKQEEQEKAQAKTSKLEIPPTRRTITNLNRQDRRIE